MLMMVIFRYRLFEVTIFDHRHIGEYAGLNRNNVAVLQINHNIFIIFSYHAELNCLNDWTKCKHFIFNLVLQNLKSLLKRSLRNMPKYEIISHVIFLVGHV